ncbi:MAG TPA: hypothetical protein VMV37_00075 [Gammaproteobacteria bacterium]|nr:hypothetical protein [Gammaproteobacteria bacterium]
MKAVARLMLAYFTGTRLLAVVTAIGVVCVAGGTSALLYLPPLVAQNGLPSRFTLAQETAITMLPVAGMLCVVFGASLMPAMLTRLATSHYTHLLPYGRAKLLASALCTVALVSAVASATASLYYLRTPIPIGLVFERAFTVSLLTYTLLYIVLWFMGRSRSIGKLVGLAAAIAALALPLRFFAVPSMSLVGPWIACALLWAALAAGFLSAPRIAPVAARLKHSFVERFGAASYRGGGREIDFMLGTANPWPLALGQVVPLLIAAYFLRGYVPVGFAPNEAAPHPWLFFVTILSVVSGAMTSVAATRSRALWLRGHWTREELFARVERAFWASACFPLGVLFVALVAIGSYLAMPTKALAFGLGFVSVGTALSTYLGLLITAAVGWRLAVLAVATMLALMVASMYVATPATPWTTIVALEAGLAATALVFRQLAARRWRHLDWMLCRPDSTTRAAA